MNNYEIGDNQKFQSSVLRCYDGDNHCACCCFIGGNRDTEILLEVIRVLDQSLAMAEMVERGLMEVVAGQKERIDTL